MSGLDLHETRRINFMALLAEALEKQGLRRGDVAKMIGQKPEYISHVTNPDPQKRRVINENMARRIENAFGKERYWLDNSQVDETGIAAKTDAIALAIRSAQSVMDSYSKKFSQDQQDQVYRAAIAAALRQPLTESQYRVIIDLFIATQ